LKKILFILLYAVLFALLSSCQKVETPFTFTFYTSNPNLPDLYVYEGKHKIGKVNYNETNPTPGDAALTTFISDKKNTRVVAIDAQGNEVAAIKFTLDNDGTYVSSGGGYLWYDLTQPEKYKINVDFTGQIK
jgi:hypothetical protein